MNGSWGNFYRYGMIAGTCGLAGLFGAWAIYALLIAIAAATLVLIGMRARPWLTTDLATKLFAAAFGFYALSFIVSAREVQDALFILNYLPFLLFAPLAKIMHGGARAGNNWRFALAALGGTILLALWASYQKYGLGTRRPEGLEIDTIAYAHTALTLGLISGVGVFASDAKWRWLFLLGPVLGIAVTLMTESRGPLLAAPVLLLVVLIAWTRRPVASILASAGIAAVSLATIWALSPSTFLRIETIIGNLSELLDSGAVSESSSRQRIEMYLAGWRAFLDSPWFGHGWEQKFSAITPYLDQGSRVLNAGHHHLHSDPVDVAVTNGVSGLIGYGLVLLAPFAGAVASPRDSQYVSRVTIAALLGAGYAIFGLTYLLFGYEYHTTLYVVLAAIAIGFCRDPGSDQKMRKT